MKNTKLYRKRFMPNEIVLLKDDSILYRDEDVVVTKWEVLKPREDFQRGLSCYFLKKGFKVSKFFDKYDKLVYHYCDIIDTQYNAENDEFIFSDLLVDVIVELDGTVRIVDLAELADALNEGIINQDIVKKALWRLNALIEILYNEDCDAFVRQYFEKAGVF